MAKGNKYGAHRVIEPQGLLPQAAKRSTIRWRFTITRFSWMSPL